MTEAPPIGNSLIVGTRAEMAPGTPLPDLNGLGGPAYAAQSRGDASTGLLAVLCNTGLPTRLDVVTAMRSCDHPSILRLIDNGVVLWPQDNVRYMAYAFQRPSSSRLANSIDDTFQVMSEDNFHHYFTTPMIGALLEMARAGVVHNAIRTTNIFWRMGSATPPQLGECLTAPAGYNQPVLFEPLERAMCHPLGRGQGSHVDDCYSFGVTLAILAMGENPLRGMSDEEIIQLKTERGSFGAIVGTRRLWPSIIELLRGLLTDDARQRWTAADLEQWLNGRRLTPKNSDNSRRASRHLLFAGKEYWALRPLAAAMSTHTAEASKILENGTIDKWLRRSLGDDERANDLLDAQESLKASGKTANYEDQLVSRACIALDPAAPIRYRGLSVMPMGIAALMIEAMKTGANIQALSEIISSQLVTLWIEMQRELKQDLVPLAQQFERMRTLIEKTTFGNGIERVVYELNPGLPCLSPFLVSQYVTSAKSLLPALERISASGNRPREPMDRHLAAFLIVRDRRSELIFNSMSGGDMSLRKGIALLTLYSDLQYKYGPDSLPSLAQWLAPFVEPSVQRFLGKANRERTHKELKDSLSRGDLGHMLRIIDDPRRLELNHQEFMAARMLYLNIQKEILHLESRLANREAMALSLGKPMAATLCSFVAIILVILSVARAVLKALQI